LIQNNDEVEELVRLAAADVKIPAVAMGLFRSLLDVQVFFCLKITEIQGGEQKATPLLQLPDATNAMMLYTSKTHPDLSDTFGGGRLEDALRAALRMPPLDWVILSNSASEWVAITKKQIPAILDSIDSNGDVVERPVSPSASSSADPAVEELITRAVHEDPEPLSQPIASQLSGRELFLELNAASTGDVGEPVLNMYKIQHLTNVIRAYSTRIRPRITYAGITWEALKEMVRKQPEIQGVQIINDADDWVVFDRESPVMR
jgi:hypothetical protein